MALNAASETKEEQEAPFKDTIIRWKHLFGYSHADVVDAIERHRSSLSRTRISDEHWHIVREGKEVKGYDGEAYEHELEIGGRRVKAAMVKMNGATRRTIEKERYIVKLEDDLTTDAIEAAMVLDEKLEVVEGSGEDGDARFCVVDSATRHALLDRYTTSRFRPTFVRVSRPAEKQLSNESRYPNWGLILYFRNIDVLRGVGQLSLRSMTTHLVLLLWNSCG